MKVTVDLSGLDEFVEEVDENTTELMKEAAQRAVYMQKERNVSNKKTYQNHTWNLRNAPGAAIVRDGKIVDLYIPADGEHSQAKNRTEAMLIFGSKPKDGVVVADGMEYASFVSSVILHSYLYIQIVSLLLYLFHFRTVLLPHRYWVHLQSQ